EAPPARGGGSAKALDPRIPCTNPRSSRVAVAVRSSGGVVESEGVGRAGGGVASKWTDVALEGQVVRIDEEGDVESLPVPAAPSRNECTKEGVRDPATNRTMQRLPDLASRRHLASFRL